MLTDRDLTWDSSLPPPGDVTARTLAAVTADPDTWPEALADALAAAHTYRVLYLETLTLLRAADGET
jgi:hypothetical protein